MAPSKPRSLGRPDDVPSWKECFARGWRWSKWNLLLVPLMPFMVLGISKVAFLDAKTADDAARIATYNSTMIKVMPFTALTLWLMLFLLAGYSERVALTPKEKEERERRQLQALKRKYDNV